jgi:hypothetical protein
VEAIFPFLLLVICHWEAEKSKNQRTEEPNAPAASHSSIAKRAEKRAIKMVDFGKIAEDRNRSGSRRQAYRSTRGGV